MTIEEFNELVNGSKELTPKEFHEAMTFLYSLGYNKEYYDLVKKLNAVTTLRTRIKGSRKGFNEGNNLMGCSENWYSPNYAIANTFSDAQIDGFSDDTLDALFELAVNISDDLY